jgi:hypothetical protein
MDKRGLLAGVGAVLAGLVLLVACEKNRGLALTRAADTGDEDTVRALIAVGTDVNARDAHDRTALMIAAENGHGAVASILLENGADPNAVGRHVGDTALMNAAYRGHADIVTVLIGHGADVNAVRRDGVTALILAARKDRVDIVETLLEKGAKVDAADDEGRTPLMIAKANGNVGMIEMLTRAGALQ